MKKIGIFILVLIGAIITISLLSHFFVSYRKSVSEKKLTQSYEQTEFNSEEIKEDLEFFQDLLTRVHPDQISSFPLGCILRE